MSHLYGTHLRLLLLSAYLYWEFLTLNNHPQILCDECCMANLMTMTCRAAIKVLRCLNELCVYPVQRLSSHLDDSPVK